MPLCRSCEADIEWGTTAVGKHMPLDAAPTDEGTWVLIGGKARPATDEDRRLLRPRHMPHWAHCPGAAEFRRRR